MKLLFATLEVEIGFNRFLLHKTKQN
uniref:Uncharacterized protein n=1 Tax=Listeria monocytogenes TaxID=1639 RepID=Q4ZJI0_LISMN|nr:hypothetical protein [Listeria monocytogenes]